MNKSLKVYRGLTPIEEYHYHLNTTGVYSCFVVGARLDQKITEDDVHFYKSLHKLISERKILRLNVFQSKSKCFSYEIMCYHLKQLVSFERRLSELTDELNQLHSIPMETDSLAFLWKIILTNDNWILFVCDHSLMDGNTASFFLEDLISLLNFKPIEKDIDHSEDFQKLTKASYCVVLKAIWNIYVPMPLKKLFSRKLSKYEVLDDTWKPFAKKPLPNPTFRTRKKLIQLSTDNMKHLKLVMKEHGVTFTSYLLYFIVQSLQEFTNKPIKGTVAIDQRKIMGFNRPYGIYVSALTLELPTSVHSANSLIDKIDWYYILFINEQLQKEKLEMSAQTVGLLDYVTTRSYIEELANSPRDCLFEVSNLGIRPDFEDDEVSVLEYIFSQPSSPIGPYITHDIISTSKTVNLLISCVPEFEMFFESYVDSIEKAFHLF